MKINNILTFVIFYSLSIHLRSLALIFMNFFYEFLTLFVIFLSFYLFFLSIFSMLTPSNFPSIVPESSIIRNKIRANNRRLTTRYLSKEFKEKLALKFSKLLQQDPTKKLLKENASSYQISFKTALRWARNPDNMKPTLQKSRLSRSKLSREQIQTIKPFFGNKLNKWIQEYIKSQFDIQVSAKLVSVLKKKYYLPPESTCSPIKSKLTLEQKEEISQIAKEKGIQKISKQFKIKSSTLRLWTKKNMNPKEQMKRLKSRGKKPRLNEDMKTILKSWVQDRNQRGRLVSLRKIRRKISNLTIDNWKPSFSSISTIVKSLRIVSRKAIYKKAQQISLESKEKLKQFYEQVNSHSNEFSDYPEFQIWCMDETGVWNSSPALRSFTCLNNPEPFVKTPTTNGRDTFVVTISNTGFVLPPFAIKHIPEKSHYKMINGRRTKEVRVPRLAGMTLEKMNEWVDQFIQYASPEDILIMDNLSCHKNKAIVKRLEDRLIKVIYTPPSLACKVSPLDNSLFSQMKAILRQKKSFKNFKQKKKGVERALKKISNQQIWNYWKNCGLPVKGNDYH